jgi:hypothetical protein
MHGTLPFFGADIESGTTGRIHSPLSVLSVDGVEGVYQTTHLNAATIAWKSTTLHRGTGPESTNTASLPIPSTHRTFDLDAL